MASASMCRQIIMRNFIVRNVSCRCNRTVRPLTFTPLRKFTTTPLKSSVADGRAAANEEPSGIAENAVLLSDSCVKQLKRVADTNGYLRVQVEGGGCSGFQYKFFVDSAVNDDDKIIERDGAKVIVDTDSIEYLKGATIDYHEELIRSAFRVLGNPQAEQGCSCGASFSLKL